MERKMKKTKYNFIDFFSKLGKCLITASIYTSLEASENN